MYTIKPFRFFILIGFLFFIPLITLQGQSDSLITILKAEAQNEFKAGNYLSALEKYESLLSRFPKEAIFHYYKGICLYETGSDMNKASGSLSFASGRPGVPADVYYYLGMIYMKTYQFNKAKESFDLLRQTVSKQDDRHFDSPRLSGNAENALRFTQRYNPYELLSLHQVGLSGLSSKHPLVVPGGRFVEKPSELFLNGEKPGELTSYIFLPSVLEKGDYVYMGGYGKLQRGGTELFRVKYLNNRKWGTPEPITNLNTAYDEILPYFDPIDKDLYFASQGHSSMGGFDVFKSRYDEERNRWSEPVNLGFPINSPFDELLFIPGTNMGEVLLITNRIAGDTIYSIYRLQMKDPAISLTGKEPKELEKIASLGAGMAGGNQAMKAPDQDHPEIVEVVEEKPDKKPSGINKPESLNLPVALKDNLKQALLYQYKSDSLAFLAKESRLKAKEISDPVKRWNLQKEIIEWEKNSVDYQGKADDYYAQLKESEASLKKTETYPPVIKPDTVLNGLTVYRFTPTNPDSSDDNTGKQQEIGEAGQISVKDGNFEDKKILSENERNLKDGETDTVKAMNPATPMKPVTEAVRPMNPDSESAGDSFQILEKSPYSSVNPIPVDTPLPKGPVYKIQLGVFSQQISNEFFGGISPVTGETVAGKSMTRFYAGRFSRYKEASQALETLKKKGFKDAFIVAWYDGQKMPADRVQELERRGN